MVRERCGGKKLRHWGVLAFFKQGLMLYAPRDPYPRQKDQDGDACQNQRIGRDGRDFFRRRDIPLPRLILPPLPELLVSVSAARKAAIRHPGRLAVRKIAVWPLRHFAAPGIFIRRFRYIRRLRVSSQQFRHTLWPAIRCLQIIRACPPFRRSTRPVLSSAGHSSKRPALPYTAAEHTAPAKPA